MNAQQTQLLVQAFLLSESRLVPLNPGLSTGPPDVEFSVFLEKITASRRSSASGEMELSFSSVKRAAQERVFKLPEKTDGAKKYEALPSKANDSAAAEKNPVKTEDPENAVNTNASVKPADDYAPADKTDRADIKSGAMQSGSKNQTDASPPSAVKNDSGDSDAVNSVSANASKSEDVKPAEEATAVDDDVLTDGVYSHVEFLLVQFVFLLNGNAPVDDAAQNVPSVDAGSVTLTQNNLMFANADGAQTDASQIVLTGGSQTLSLALANELKELQNAAVEFLQTVDPRVEGAHLKAGGTGTLTDSELSMKLSKLLNELQGVVDELTAFVPQTFTDAGAEKLKELMQFAEQVRLLVQKVSDEAEQELKLQLAREADSAMNAQDAILADNDGAVHETVQQAQAALNAEELEDNAAEIAQTETDESSEAQNVSSVTSQVDAAQDTEQNAVVSAVDAQSADMPDEPFTQSHLTRFVDDAVQKAAQVLEKASGGALSSAQKTSALTALAALSQKNGAGALFAMDFKELMNVPKAFIEEVQNIMQLKDFSVAGVQVMQDSLVTAALSAEKLSLAFSDFGKGAQNGNDASFAKPGNEPGTEFKLDLPPALSQVNIVLQNNTVSVSRAVTAGVRDAEESVMKFSQALVKSGQLLLSAGTADMRIRLKPEHLGDLRLRIMMDEGILSATFTAQSQQVKEILESNMSSLKQSLKDQGINVEKFVVTTGNPGDYAQAQQNAGNSAMNQQSVKSAVSFTGDGKDDEEKSAKLQTSNPSRAKLSQVDYLV